MYGDLIAGPHVMCSAAPDQRGKLHSDPQPGSLLCCWAWLLPPQAAHPAAASSASWCPVQKGQHEAVVLHLARPRPATP